MSYVTQTLTRTAAESSGSTYEAVAAEMAQDLTALLVSADSRITALSGDENGVLINGKFKLIIEAGTISGANTVVLTIRNESTDLASCYAAVRTGTGTTARNFLLNVHVFISDTVFSLILRNVKTTGSNFNVNICSFTDENGGTVVGYTATTSYNASSSRNFASDTSFFDLADNSQGKTIAKRLPYVHDGTAAELATLSGKVILSGSQRAADVGGVIECSTVTGDMVYPSGGKTYYAIDDNTLAEI